MAVMVPRSPVAGASGAERRVFQRLEVALDDTWTVIHQARFFDPEARGRTQDREADFIIAHPELGAVVLEVKGGQVRYEAASGGWLSVDHGGEAHSIRDPFQQALDASYSLIRYLRSLPNWPARWAPIAHMVCFPDGDLVSEPTPSVRAELIIQGSDLVEDVGLEERIRMRLSIASEGRAAVPDRAWFEALVGALARDIEIRPLLGTQVAEADRVIELSDRQFELLGYLKGNRRVAVRGPAGSGKTLLAMEQARRLAISGYQVLYTCFNRSLADYLITVTGEIDGLEISNYHRLARRLAAEAGLDVTSGDQGQRYFDNTLPGLMEQALAINGPLFDAVIVDEGQDFSSTWWRSLEAAMRDPGTGIFYVFYDDNQAIYDRPSGLPDGLFDFRLYENWRNTKQIHEAIMAFYEGEEIVCRGPDGAAVEIRRVATGETRDVLAAELQRLIDEESISEEDIVVLTPRSIPQSSVRGRVGRFTLKEEPAEEGEVRLSSIYRFKGLESRVVVVCEVDRNVSPNLRKLLYVAFSRAKTLLVVLMTSDDPENASVDDPTDDGSKGTADTVGSSDERDEMSGALTTAQRQVLIEYEERLRHPPRKRFVAAIREALERGDEPPQEWPGLDPETAARVRHRALRRVERADGEGIA